MRLGSIAHPASRTAPAGAWGSTLLHGQLTQHEVEHAAVAVVLGLRGGVDQQAHWELLDRAVGPRGAQRHPRNRLAPIEGLEAEDVDDIGAGKALALGLFSGQELQRQHAHAHEVRAVDALEGLDEDGPRTEQPGVLRGPVAD